MSQAWPHDHKLTHLGLKNSGSNGFCGSAGGCNAILKSPQAVQATLAIIETFSKIRELSRNIKTLSDITDKTQQKNLMQKSGEIITELLDDDLQTRDTETSIELNFAVLKFKHAIK